MTESIGSKLNTIISAILPFYLSEAEVEEYPFAVYDQTITPYRTKDGIYRYSSSCKISVVSDDFSVADTKAESIKAAIASNMNDSQYTSELTSYNKDCVEGIWTIELNYTINQRQ